MFIKAINELTKSILRKLSTNKGTYCIPDTFVNIFIWNLPFNPLNNYTGNIHYDRCHFTNEGTKENSLFKVTQLVSGDALSHSLWCDNSLN